jgi:heptosyltransferase-1
MFSPAKPASRRILVVRLGAMGDIIHTLPAAASLKHSYPGSHLTWIVEPRWIPLLEDNPFIDRIAVLRRDSLSGIFTSWRELRSDSYDLAVDFQGLFKSGLVASASHASRIFGFHRTQLRERIAAFFYSDQVLTRAAHVVDRNLELATAAGATSLLRAFPLPAGSPEGELPAGDFVLASPLAGWAAKQWPIEHYRALASRLHRDLRIPLVLNAPSTMPPVEDAIPHVSGIAGLIHATRRAAAVLAVDSGPGHMAAALGKPGVALFGPTDPARNGPYGDTLRILRAPGAVTTYKRTGVGESMRHISPDEVFEALRTVMGKCLV